MGRTGANGEKAPLRLGSGRSSSPIINGKKASGKSQLSMARLRQLESELTSRMGEETSGKARPDDARLIEIVRAIAELVSYSSLFFQ